MSLIENDNLPSKKLKQPLTELTDRMRAVIGRLVYGDPERGGKPQTVEEIADALSVLKDIDRAPAEIGGTLPALSQEASPWAEGRPAAG